MSLSAKTVLFVRRLSVFYLLVGIFSVFFGIFYYKYLPANQAELDTRGFRILDQLSSNMVAKNANLREAFHNTATCNTCDSVTKAAVLEQIQEHMAFDQGDSARLATNIDSIRYLPDTGWCLIYPSPNRKVAIVRISDFLQPVLAARDDLFDNYVLLNRVPSRKDSSHQMQLLYLQKTITSSYALNTDSALALQKNTDLSDITAVAIGGEVYNLFYQPFDFAGAHLVLGGLIRKSNYERQVKNLPAHFVVGVILIILLGLVILPFLKVFFISPKEQVKNTDVLRVALSIYLGAAVLVLAGGYFLADLSAHGLVETHLKQISDKLEKDIHHDLQLADQQLQTYKTTYDNLGPAAKLLAYQAVPKTDTEKVNSAFIPLDYPLTARITWFDSTGATLAKWNPYQFVSPRSSVSGYPFFKQVERKNAIDTSVVLSAGKSNITSEFQMFLARRLNQRIDTARGNSRGSAMSYGLLMAFYLHSGLRPVLPRGYGFCLVDNRSMQVLMHSDARRNVSENLYLETGENPRVKICIDQKLETWIEEVDLYGSPNTFYTRPVSGQEVSLVVFYDNNTHAENIFRMIHFGAEGVLYLFLLYLLCLVLSTGLLSRPSKLSFNIDAIEWVRPRERNERSYVLTWKYFLALLLLSLSFFLLLWPTGSDIRIAFYISILLPFYALWGFVASRKKETPRFPPDTPVRDISWLPWPCEVFFNAKIIVITIALLNWFIIRLVFYRPDMDHSGWVYFVVVLFQILATGTMLRLYQLTFRRGQKKDTKNAFLKNYIRSLYFSMLVITIVPTLGLLWYGWSVEKIQFLRSDQLSIAQKNIEHLRYIDREILPAMKPKILNALDCTRYTDYLMHVSSRYLAGEEIYPLPFGVHSAFDPDASRDPDQPYITFLDELFVFTAGEYNSYSVRIRSADTSWSFLSHAPTDISLLRSVHLDTVTGGGSADPRLKDFKITTPLEGSLFSLGSVGTFHGSLLVLAMLVFLLSFPLILRHTCQRLFLLRFNAPDAGAEQRVLAAYYPGGQFPVPDFQTESGKRLSVEKQEGYVLHTMLQYKPLFQKIWKGLSKEERFFLYNFAGDGYANYRDSELLLTLIEKGLLTHVDDKWHLFAVSFREFLLLKKGKPEITSLKARFSIPGVWTTIRIPTLIVIAACAVLLLLTQENVSHRVTGLVTSVGAIVPVVLEITKKFASRGAA